MEVLLILAGAMALVDPTPPPPAAPPAVTPAAPSPAAGAPSQPFALRLICRGEGERTVANGVWGGAYSSNGRYTSVYGVANSQSNFGDQLDIDINGATARARVPRRFLPPAHGGAGGWFTVKDLVVTDDAITGTVLINFAQHPKLRIDRRSGSVAMDGKVGSFSGQCQPFDATQRAF